MFKSRLGICNLVLGISGFGHQPDVAVLRKLRSRLEQTSDLALANPANAQVFQYLIDKKLIGADPRAGGRYAAYAGLQTDGRAWVVLDRHGKAISELPTFSTDVWMSHPAIPSTIGVPTPDNVDESFEMAFQFRLLTKSKNTWTAAGQLTQAVRQNFAYLVADSANPFLLGVECVPLLRQLLDVDGLIMRELVRELASPAARQVSRDQVAVVFPDIVARAVERARESGVGADSMRDARAFLALIRETAAKSGLAPRHPLGSRGRWGRGDEGATRPRQRNATRGPGVLEHRVTPRLEWLTDLGYLTKHGLQRNGFTYWTTDALGSLLADLDSVPPSHNWADEVAVSQWKQNSAWLDLHGAVATVNSDLSFGQAYKLMRRQIGPAPLREVAFAAALLSSDEVPFSRAVADLTSFARTTKGASLSGGTYRRTPENIFVPESSLPA